MKRRRSLQARIDRLDPAPSAGGVLHIEDVESGLIRVEDLPTRGGGYLYMPRPCQTAEEWVRQCGGVKYPGGQPPAPKETR
jgi:hypothetical protein